MTSSIVPGRQAASLKAVEKGLEPGYAEDKWGPWKSHKLLLNEAIATTPSWANRAGMFLSFVNLFVYFRCSEADLRSFWSE